MDESTTAPFRIRPARPDDAAQIAPLLADVGFPAEPAEIVDRLEALADTGDHIFVASAGDSVCAVATLHLTPALHRAAPVGRITLLVVAEEHRSMGIGRALVEACEHQIAVVGGSIVEVISNLRYADAHDFYRRLGYELTSHKFKKTLEP